MGQVTQYKNAFEVSARHVQADGIGPRCHDQDIIGQDVSIGQMDGSPVGIDGFHAGLYFHIHAGFAELLRGPHHKLFIILDYITDVIGHRSGRVRNKLTPLDDGCLK